MTQISQAAHDGNRSMAPLRGNKASEHNMFTLIERHRKTVLSSPFILAGLLVVVYMFGGNEIRRVLDFMSPGHIFGH